ncbi:glycoside hydrolase family 88/105 protein [Winogradskyella poriferorum]|uniref:Glycoside hydrolase family 88 protein n=1 Tax=Winogradskyella poriferorum TaxID=307627 RepID=A0ABU7W7X6_9FLAO
MRTVNKLRIFRKHFISKRQVFIVVVICLFYACQNQKREDAIVKVNSVKVLGELVTDDLLSRSDFMMYQTEEVQALHYAEICAAYGATKLAAFLKDNETINKLIERYREPLNDKIINTSNHVDANVYGILPLELYIQTNNEKYLEQGLRFADGQWENPLPNGLTSQTRYWIDDIYMIGCLQVQAYRATGNMKYLERAALEIDSYIKKLQQPNGLFFHGPDAPFFWGRGNGWVAAGLAELLSVLPKENVHYNSLLSGYKKMMKSLLHYQSNDGMWHQLIDNNKSFKETSSTAMFGFAISVGVKKRLLPEKRYKEAYEKAWNALTNYIDKEGKVSQVCVGTGQSKDEEYYLNRPKVTGDFHGQAPMLWFAHSLLEIIE